MILMQKVEAKAAGLSPTKIGHVDWVSVWYLTIVVHLYQMQSVGGQD